MTEYRCPRHLSERLRYVLRGGAGYCSICRLYTQAAGVPEPKPVKKRAKKGRAKTR